MEPGGNKGVGADKWGSLWRMTVPEKNDQISQLSPWYSLSTPGSASSSKPHRSLAALHNRNDTRGNTSGKKRRECCCFFFFYSLHCFSWEPDGTINPQSTQEYQVALTPAWGTLPSSVVSPWLMSIQLYTLTQLAVWICSPIWQMGRVSLSLAAASEIFPDISQTADPPSAQPSIFLSCDSFTLREVHHQLASRKAEGDYTGKF